MSGQAFLTTAQGADCLRAGEVVAYPTEAVYGLGCDPASEPAVRRILAMKHRSADAGLILIADHFERFQTYLATVSAVELKRAQESWPGPVTWLFPRAAGVPDWLAGKHSTIAVRVTAHPVCRALCEAFQGPVVSTSANPHEASPAKTAQQVSAYFGAKIAGIVLGSLGDQLQPSEIRDVATGAVIRSGSV